VFWCPSRKCSCGFLIRVSAFNSRRERQPAYETAAIYRTLAVPVVKPACANTACKTKVFALFSGSELHAKKFDSGSSLRPAAGDERLRWRAWPCSKCSGGVTPIRKLLDSFAAGEGVPEHTPEEIAVNQIATLKEWIASCSHAAESEIPFPRLAEGSEHLVFLDADTATVFKATRPNLFGESYCLDATGKINQRNCSPLEYLIRLRLWKKLFSSEPRDLGMTACGQFVSSQKFIAAKDPENPTPTQNDVDSFLTAAGLAAVRQEFWLWKRTYPDFEIWVGDARSDNFVESEAGIVPN